MLDIPFFTTEFGVASLTLSEIPYKGIAYIRIQNASDAVKLIDEAAGFCRAAGATRVFVTGHKAAESFPFHTEIWEMHCLRSVLPETDSEFVALQESALENWRNIYNLHMFDVPNAATMTLTDAKEILKKGSGYFVYRDQILIGIGIAAGACVQAVISVVPGAGKDVLLALNRVLSGPYISVEVASENHRAIALYDRLGFVKKETLSCWYEII